MAATCCQHRLVPIEKPLRRNCRQGHFQKSAGAEHALETRDYQILFEKTSVLAKTTGYHCQLVREAIEIETQKQFQQKGRKRM